MNPVPRPDRDSPRPGRRADPVGTVEIATRLGVSRSTVDAWRTRHADTFPRPRWTVGGRPAWNWDDIEAWHAARGTTA